MADPGTPFNERRGNINGVGPYDFQNPDPLDPGNTWTINFRSYENGRFMALTERGWDEAELSNYDTGNPIVVSINEATSRRVPTETTRGVEIEGMYRFDVENVGTGTIAAEDVELTVLQTPFDADQQARERATQSPIERVVRNLTGL